MALPTSREARLHVRSSSARGHLRFPGVSGSMSVNLHVMLPTFGFFWHSMSFLLRSATPAHMCESSAGRLSGRILHVSDFGRFFRR
jgi:hypothetical protein